MNSNAILSSDVLDILFDNRNKNYGAYTLRKFYPERVKTSLFIMLGFAAVLSAFTFLPKAKNITDRPFGNEKVLITTLLEQKKEIEKPKEQPQEQAKPKQTQQVTDNFTVVKDNKPSTVFNSIENMAVGTVTDTSGVSTAIAEPPLPAEGSGVAPTPPAPPVETEAGPIDNPDVQPTYPGGPEALRRFLEKNLQAPEELSEAVQVRIKFVVGNEGNLESFDIVQSGGEEFNNEVIRVLKKMPQWNAGKKGGRSVKVYCYLPVTFAPND